MSSGNNLLIAYWVPNNLYGRIKDLAISKNIPTSDVLPALFEVGLGRAPGIKELLPVDKRTNTSYSDNYKPSSFVISPVLFDQAKKWGKERGLDRNEFILQLLSIGFQATGHKPLWEVLEEKWEAGRHRALGAAVYKQLKAYAKNKKLSFRAAHDEVLEEGVDKCSPAILRALIETGLGKSKKKPKARPLVSPRKKAAAKKAPVKKKAPAKTTRRAA